MPLCGVAQAAQAFEGLGGWQLLGSARRHVQGQRSHFQLRGLSKPEVEQAVFWEAVALDAMARWRKVHIPIFIVFSVLALVHIVSVFLFWGWV